mmetsp:Transcript_98575/g.195556  ORF Transcript_98575/g.195556 Transcript_98575/m.195556 type:complete len:225 (+) Transcript_98575:89-763(+)
MTSHSFMLRKKHPDKYKAETGVLLLSTAYMWIISNRKGASLLARNAETATRHSCDTAPCKLASKQLCSLICSMGSIRCSQRLHGQAQSLPTSESARKNRHSLPRIGLLAVPVRTLWCPMCRVLACEYYQTLVCPLLDQLRNLCWKWHCIDRWFMDCTINEASSTVLASKINQQASPGLQEIVYFFGINVLNIFNRRHSIGQVGRNVCLLRGTSTPFLMLHLELS